MMLLAMILTGWGIAGLGLSTRLFGSAPDQQDWSAPAADVRVVDGETLRLGDRVVRLYGVNVPARGEKCADSTGRGFDCGAAAAERLSMLIQNRALNCLVHGRDAFGRALGVCQAGEVALNGGLVAAGWALAEEGGQAGLLLVEKQARDAGKGLWAAGMTPPEGWRNRN
ncbi:thermonuclease family protein [Acetobacteraceae bacterium H6797]|nr:thermonuclease family protein [Acetobacteraceae bacterium H6797]